MNVWVGTGRLTKKPELRHLSNNKAVTSFTLAVNKYPEGADFINCIAWEKQAENLCKYQDKGNQVAVEGRIQTRSYDDKNGKRVYVTEVVAINIQFLDGKKEGQAPKEEVIETDPFADFGAKVEQGELEISDDDLPF